MCKIGQNFGISAMIGLLYHTESAVPGPAALGFTLSRFSLIILEAAAVADVLAASGRALQLCPPPPFSPLFPFT